MEGRRSEHTLAEKLEECLSASDGERCAAAFLRKNPWLVFWAFSKMGGHTMYVLHEFPIGIGHRADFVVAFSYSGAWEVFFVELERVVDPVITKGGRPTKVLASAISQIGDWRDYVDRNRPSIQRDLSNWCVKKDILRVSKINPPSNYTSDLLKDADSRVHFHYSIVIGRRNATTSEARRKLGQYRHNGDIAIRSYDLFLDVAFNLDQREANPRQPILVSRTQE